MKYLVIGTAFAIMILTGCACTGKIGVTPASGTKLYSDAQAVQFKAKLPSTDFSTPKEEILKTIGVDRPRLTHRCSTIDGRVAQTIWQLSPSYILVEFEGGTDLQGATIRIDELKE